MPLSRQLLIRVESLGPRHGTSQTFQPTIYHSKKTGFCYMEETDTETMAVIAEDVTRGKYFLAYICYCDVYARSA